MADFEKLIQTYVLKADTSDAVNAQKAFKAEQKKAFDAMKMSAGAYNAKIEEIINSHKETGEAAKKHGKTISEELDRATIKAFLFNEAIQLGKKLLRGIAQESKQSLELALLNEKTNIALAKSARSYGEQTAEVVEQLNRESQALEEVTLVSDEAIRQHQTLALNYGATAEQATEASKASIAFANATGKSVDEAIRQLTKTFGGYAGELGEVIPELKNLTKEQLQAGDAIELINNKFGDFLDLKARGLPGSINNIARGWDNVSEALGKASTKWDALNRTIDGMGYFLNDIARIIESEGALTGLLASLSIIDPTGSIGKGVRSLSDTIDSESDLKELEALADEAARFNRQMRDFASGEAFDFGGEFGDKLMNTLEFAGAFGELGIDFQENLFTIAAQKKGGGKKKDDLSDVASGGIAFGEGDFKGFELTEEGEFLEKRLESNTDFELLLTDVKIAAEERRLELSREIYEVELDDLEKQENEKLKLKLESSKESERVREQQLRIGLTITRGLANDAADAIVTAAEGGNAALDQAMKESFKTMGRGLVAKGIGHSLEGAARLLLRYGTDATAYGLMQVGATEIGAGGAMIGGSLIIPGRGIAGSGSGGGSSGGDLGAGGSIGRQPDAGGTTRGGPTTINVFGPFSDQQTIAMIEKGQQESMKAGTF